jgi:hypothetical protein
MSVLELRRANSPTEPDHSRGGLGWAGFGPNARAVFRCGRSVREMARQFLNPLFLKRSARIGRVSSRRQILLLASEKISA